MKSELSSIKQTNESLSEQVAEFEERMKHLKSEIRKFQEVYNQSQEQVNDFKKILAFFNFYVKFYLFF